MKIALMQQIDFIRARIKNYCRKFVDKNHSECVFDRDDVQVSLVA